MTEYAGALLPARPNGLYATQPHMPEADKWSCLAPVRSDMDQLSGPDLSVRAGDSRIFADLLHEQSSLPWMFDVVRPDGSESPAVAASIRGDGVELYN